MRLNRLFVCLTAFLLCFTLCSNAQTTEVTSTQLIEEAKDWDGKTINYSGEVVGDIMQRGEFAWVHILDKDSNTISCYAKASDVKQISTIGKYGVKGDIVSVNGKFNRACPEHGGDLDIHVDSLQIKEKGYKLEMYRSNTMFIIACLSFIVAVVLLIMVRKKLKS